MAELLKVEPTAIFAVPALIAEAGDRAAWRFVEFFTVNIRNKNTRAAYGRAAAGFLAWCEGRGIRSLAAVQPVHVAAYIEGLERHLSAPSVKQHLACIRMLFDWLVTGQVVPANLAHAVRGPRYSVSRGSTRVISSSEATALLHGMDVSHVVGLRDRALIAVMTYTFARVSAVVALAVEDYYPQKKHWWLKLHEKNGKLNEMPCHPKLAQYLDEYIDAAGIAGEKKSALFAQQPGERKPSAPDRSRASMLGAWCAGVPKMLASRPQSAVTRSAQPA